MLSKLICLFFPLSLLAQNQTLSYSKGTYQEHYRTLENVTIDGLSFDLAGQKLVAINDTGGIDEYLEEGDGTRWLSLDPLEAKFTGISPYSGMANSPIYFLDLDGREIYDGASKIIIYYEQGQVFFKREDGSKISREFRKNGQRILNAMSKTEIGRDAINIWVKTPAKVKLEIGKLKEGYGDTKVNGGAMEMTYETLKSKDVVKVTIDLDKVKNDKENYKNDLNSSDPNVVKNAAINNRFYNVNTAEEALGTVGTHEAFHITSEQQAIDWQNQNEQTQAVDNNFPINSEVTFREQYNPGIKLSSNYTIPSGYPNSGEYKGLEKTINNGTIKYEIKK